MSGASFRPPLNQIAFSVVDLRRTERWFREGLGFLPAGGNALMMSSPIAGRVQGLPRAASTCWWLVGRNPWFQLEMFQFRRPIARLMPADFRPCDIGYTRIGVHVADFDTALADLGRLGSAPLAPVQGAPGRRRACVRSPDGVPVEVMEDDPLPRAAGGERPCPAAVRSVTLSTPDLAASVAYLAAVTGRAPESIALHSAEHEALWGLAGATCERAVFETGDVLVEVVQYRDPVGRSWPDGYRICDQGILNIAFGARSRREHDEITERAVAFGARPNWRPFHLPGAGVVYLDDPLGFSVEVLWIAPGSADRRWGFEPLPEGARPDPDDQRVSARVQIAAPRERVWEVLRDHDGMSRWIGFDRVRRTRSGSPDPDGYGSEREMRGPFGRMVEQVTGFEPGHRIRYRIIEGSPFVYHNGEIELTGEGEHSVVEWTIRFRSRWPGSGGVMRRLLQRMLDKMLREGLAPHVEQAV